MEKQRFDFNEAMPIASGLVTELTPHCIRIEIAGSLRRKSPTVGDIEVVILPKKVNTGLFEEYPELQPVPELLSIINKYEKIRGDLSTGKYTQRLLPEGIKLDVFTATEETWGLHLAIRTGSSAFSYKRLACRWTAMGYRSYDRILHKDGIAIPLKEELDLFKLLCIPWVKPEDRN